MDPIAKLRVIEREIRKMKQAPLKAEELERMKELLLAGVVLTQEIEKDIDDPKAQLTASSMRDQYLVLLEALESILQSPKYPNLKRPSFEYKSGPVPPLSMEHPRQTRSGVCSENVLIEKPKFKLADLVGLREIKEELYESISWPLLFPEEMTTIGFALKGVLLFGPPGCGKTHLVRCIGGELGTPLIVARPSEVMQKYVGESEQTMREIFVCARKLAPTIVFVDEIDKFVPKDISSSSDVLKRVEAQLLQEMDGVSPNMGVVVVFATNQPEKINPALIRSGRIDRKVYVPPPDKKARQELFKLNLTSIPKKNINWNQLTALTEPKNGNWYSGADIEVICRTSKTALFRIWKKKREVIPKGAPGKSLPLKKRTPLTMSILLDNLKRVKPSISPEMIQHYKMFS
ncbi:MAG: AAA family ATPase [Candidatus Hermodarchaeota archaeon]